MGSRSNPLCRLLTPFRRSPRPLDLYTPRLATGRRCTPSIPNRWHWPPLCDRDGCGNSAHCSCSTSWSGAFSLQLSCQQVTPPRPSAHPHHAREPHTRSRAAAGPLQARLTHDLQPTPAHLAWQLPLQGCSGPLKVQDSATCGPCTQVRHGIPLSPTLAPGAHPSGSALRRSPQARPAAQPQTWA